MRNDGPGDRNISEYSSQYSNKDIHHRSFRKISERGPQSKVGSQSSDEEPEDPNEIPAKITVAAKFHSKSAKNF
jgi:hypothetical protein